MLIQSRPDSTKLDPESVHRLLAGWSAGEGPLYVQLATAIAAHIDDGSLRGGDRLPAERALAAELAVSRGTVVKAYERLAAAECVTRLQGSGTTVSGNRLDSPRAGAEFVGGRLWTSSDVAVDLLKAIPDLLPEVSAAIQSANLSDHAEDLDRAEPLGWWSLRERIADRMTRQGLPTSPHEIMVTSGAQQAISLTLQAFVHPGDVVLGEEFTWPGLIDGVHHLGARFQPVRMDEHGLDVEDLEAKVARYRPALITLNPQHHNPTGTRLPPERVAAIARIAREYRVPVSEDRVAASIAFDHRRLPEIATHEHHGHAITIDSVCKIAWPGLRLGWVRADPQTINRLRPYKAVNDMFSSALSQAAACSVLERVDVVTSARIEQLRRRCDLVVDLLRRDLVDWSFVRPRGGLSLWATLPLGASADAFVQHAGRTGVLVASARQFGSADADSRHLRVPFTATDDVLEAGLQRLARAWSTFDPAESPTPVAAM